MDLGLYMQSISHDILTREEERELFKKYQSGNDDARQEIITSNLRLVIYYIKSLPINKEDYLDAIQEGNLGLMKAVDRFDLTFNTKFSTYAIYWIKQSVLRYLSNNKLIHIPESTANIFKQLKRVRSDLLQEYNREPTMGELVEHTEIKQKTIERVLRDVKYMVSLNALVSDDKEELESFIAVEDLSINNLGDRIRDEKINKIIETLPDRERKVIKQRFGMNSGTKTLKRIGKGMNISRERVRQIEIQALNRIKQRATETKRYRL